jgi:uncharacterized protein YggU (UPF0235/DUF167 family)
LPSSSDRLPFAACAEGVRIRVRLTPCAAADRLGGTQAEADGGVALLAKAWRVPKSAIRVVAGASDRRKTLLVEGDPARLLERMTRMLTPEVPR